MDSESELGSTGVCGVCETSADSQEDFGQSALCVKAQTSSGC